MFHRVVSVVKTTKQKEKGSGHDRQLITLCEVKGIIKEKKVNEA